MLNYIVTSDHIHLLVVDTEEDVIAKSLQLVTGRTVQEFNQRKKRKSLWGESIAIGSEGFIEKIQQQLGLRAKGRSVVLEEEGTTLKEAPIPYNTLFEGKKSTLRPDNSYLWDLNSSNSG